MSDGMRADAAAGMSDSTRADAAAGMRVIVVDDDAIVVRSLATILGAEPDVEVVGTGTSGEEAVSLYSSCSPDVALMDIQMPGGDGLSPRSPTTTTSCGRCVWGRVVTSSSRTWRPSRRRCGP